MKILSSTPVSVSEVKEILEKRQKEGELNYEQTLALEHAEKADSAKGMKKKVEEVQDSFKKIPLATAIKIVDIKPKQPATLRAILVQGKVDLNEEEINELLKIIG
jgi:DNA-directed RNA polymerase subunit F